MNSHLRLLHALIGVWLLLTSSVIQAEAACVPAREWLDPRAGDRLAAEAVYERASNSAVVLLGETHEVAAHHRWQRATLEALHARRPEIVVGFEMFPRRAQPALDRWVAGELSQKAFLRETDWQRVWRYDPDLYMPLFEYARAQRLPMRALNVDRSLVRETGLRGFAAVPAEQREGVSTPAPATPAYVERLRDIYAQHRHADDADEQRFQRFVEAQLLWDRAMAEGIADALAERPSALVVGIIGSGHLRYGEGVAHQLRDLGITRITTLLPWTAGADCADIAPDIADALYGIPAEEEG